MTRSPLARRLAAGLGLALLFSFVPMAQAAPGDVAVDARQSERATLDLEQIFRLAFSSDGPKPVYRSLGGGLHSMSVPVSAELRARLTEAMGAESSTFLLLATGQQLTDPNNFAAMIHATLSDVDLAYNYWVVAINLGNQDLTKKTTFKLAGPGGGRKFNKKFNFEYESDTINANWYNPGGGVGVTGTYKITGQVAGATPATISTYTFAVPSNP